MSMQTSIPFILKRGCAALAVWFVKGVRSASTGTRTCTSAGTSTRFQCEGVKASNKKTPMLFVFDNLLPTVKNVGTTRRSLALAAFSPPPPPGTHGTPVFPDLDFSAAPSKMAIERYNDPDAVFVVTGASRGIGLQFVKAFVERAKGTVVACCRSPLKAQNLNAYHSSLMADDSNRIQIISLDVEDPLSLVNAAKSIKEQFNRVDILLNVAGILGDGGKTTPGPERSLSKVERNWLEKSFAVNVIGPVQFTKELLPVLNSGTGRRKVVNIQDTATIEHVIRPPTIVANLSARVGSISDNQLGGWYSYRMSKAALNQATRTMAIELKRSNIFLVALHPGTTDTDLSQPFQRNVKEGSLFPVEFTVDQLIKVIDNINESNSGGFYDWAGKSISF